MQEQGLQDVVNRNKIKFESYADLVDQAFFFYQKHVHSEGTKEKESPGTKCSLSAWQ